MEEMAVCVLAAGGSLEGDVATWMQVFEQRNEWGYERLKRVRFEFLGERNIEMWM